MKKDPYAWANTATWGIQPMQYILRIHRSATRFPPDSAWAAFFARAEASGTFRGGSEIGKRQVIGKADGVPSTSHIDGFMRFDSDDRQTLIELLASHPVVTPTVAPLSFARCHSPSFWAWSPPPRRCAGGAGRAQPTGRRTHLR